MTTASGQPIIGGQTVTIRPIQSSDCDLENEFVRKLSVETKHYRFLGGVKELAPEELKRLCSVDGRHTMAFVATIQEGGHEKEIGVSRFAEGANEGVREMAVTVADEWQHKGLGRLLTTRLIEYAKTHGVKQLYSMDLADNSAMRKLAGELGMSARSDPDDPTQVIYSLLL